MKEPVVSDSTCLIGLERIGQLDILPELFAPIMIPPEIDREFGSSYSWLLIQNLMNRVLVSALEMVVDAGEAEAIALACLLISDDKQARSVAKQLGVEVIGTVGVLVRAKQKGVITKLMPILDDLELNEFFIGRSLRAEALRRVGE